MACSPEESSLITLSHAANSISHSRHIIGSAFTLRTFNRCGVKTISRKARRLSRIINFPYCSDKLLAENKACACSPNTPHSGHLMSQKEFAPGSMRHIALEISRWLGSIPSIYFVFGYLVLIPIFGFIFYLLPGQFYYSTPARDPVTYRDMGQVCPAIKKSFSGIFEVFNRTHIFTVGRWKFDIRDVEFRFSYEGVGSPRSIALNMMLKGESLDSEGPRYCTPNLLLRIPIDIHPYTIVGKFRIHFLCPRVIESDFVPAGYLEKVFSTSEYDRLTGVDNQLLIPVEPYVIDILERYSIEVAGQGRGINQLIRMLYLSVVTLTDSWLRRYCSDVQLGAFLGLGRGGLGHHAGRIVP